MIYFDEELVEQSFILTLVDQAGKEQILSAKLQEEFASEYIRFVDKVSDLKVGDKLEALFDVDDKWYRGSITSINSTGVEVYFLDYGNTETFSLNEINSKLRFRNHYKNIEEEEVFSLGYQALKCLYSTDNTLTLTDFTNKLVEIPDFQENGFEIKVKEIVADDMESVIYRIIFSSDEDNSEGI